MKQSVEIFRVEKSEFFCSTFLLDPGGDNDRVFFFGLSFLFPLSSLKKLKRRLLLLPETYSMCWTIRSVDEPTRPTARKM